MKRNGEVDRSIGHLYERSPFDPVAGARLIGRFLGALIAYDRKMNLLVLFGSVVVGGMFFIPALFAKHVINIAIGLLILLNVIRNLLRYYFKII